MRTFIVCIFCLISALAYAGDTAFLKVHFLYGSRPLKEYQDTEKKWFGGILGGHVGIEGDSNRIINFLPSGSFHVFKKESNRIVPMPPTMKAASTPYWEVIPTA